MELNVVITIVVVAVVLAGFGIVAICYICLWKRCKGRSRRKSVVNGSSKRPNGYPKMPLFRAAARDIQIVQMMQKDQYSRYAELNKFSPNTAPPTESSERSRSFESVQVEGKGRRKDGYRKLDRSKTQHSFFFDKTPMDYDKPIRDAITCTEIYYPQVDHPRKPLPPSKSISNLSSFERRDRRSKLIQVKRSGRSLSTADIDASRLIKGRYKSEPNLLHENAEDDLESCAASICSSNAAAALSVIYPATGQIEFGLFYNPDNKSLDITINKLLDVDVKAEHFIEILETLHANSREKPKSKTYLKENDDGTLELVVHTKIGYLIYVSLLPDMTFKRHTSVLFGYTNFIFNELFSVTGYTLEELNTLALAVHVLTQFGDVEPIVIGEVNVPLKRLQACQSLPFLAHMEAPDYQLELESPLKEAYLGELQVVISYNPMHHQLVVKIIQATGIPRLGMTGHPNVSVKTSLYYCGSRINKQSTSIHKRQKEPVFNETLHFDISKDRVSECDLLFEVRHHGPVHRTVIGYVMVGRSVGGSGANHWRQLLDFSHFEKSHRIMANKPSCLV